MIKIKYVRITNPSPIVDGFELYIDGTKAHEGRFVSIDALREFYREYLVKNSFWSKRHDLVLPKGNFSDYFYNQLKNFGVPPYYRMSWSRDCDMCESTNVRRIDSYTELIKDYQSYLRGLEWAEGPSSWQLIEETESGDWSHDRALSAFENGNGRSIYC